MASPFFPIEDLYGFLKNIKHYPVLISYHHMMNKAALEHLVKEIQRIKPGPLETKRSKEILLKKYEEEENYEICGLIIKYYDLISDLIEKLNSLK